MRLFVSYRRKDLGIAQQIAGILRMRINGYVFFDERSIDDVDFEKSILAHLRQSTVVIVIVTEHTFVQERIKENNDWIRREVREALRLGKNIVPVSINAPFPPINQLPSDIQSITRMNSITLHLGYRLFEASMQNLIEYINRSSGVEGETILQKTKEELLKGNYAFAKREVDKVWDLLDNYVEPKYIAQGNFYRALILLNGKRPFVQTLPVMRDVEMYMKSALHRYKTVTYLLGLGLFKLDFSRNGLSHYEGEGLVLLNEAGSYPRRAEDEELLEILKICQPDVVDDYLSGD